MDCVERKEAGKVVEPQVVRVFVTGATSPVGSFLLPAVVA